MINTGSSARWINNIACSGRNIHPTLTSSIIVIMNIKCISIAVLTALSLAVNGQTDIYNFAENCIIIPDYEGLYGFVVGASPDKKDAYFVLIKKDKKFDETIKAAFNKEKEKSTATLIDGDIRIGIFYVGLYRIDGRQTIQKKYFKSTADYKGEYKLFTDGNRGTRITGAWERRIMDLYINPKFGITRMRDKNDYRFEQLNFGCTNPGHFGFGGLPIIDAKGNVAGVIAQTQRDNETSLYVLDIIAIREKLVQAGTRKGDACKYFNLIEAGALNDETFCEMDRRLQKEDKKRREYLESLRIQQLKQEDKRTIDEKVKKYGKRSLDPVQRRIYNQNIDRPVAFSILGNGSASLLKMKEPPGGSNKGTSIDEDCYNYFYGIGIHINPDKGRFRITLKPGVAEYGLKLPAAYSYGTTASDFALKKFRVSAYEMPVMLELVTKRTEKSTNFFAFGYGPGITRSVTFSFNTKSETDRKQTVIGKSMLYHKILGEVGAEFSKFRFAFFASYQLDPLADRNYELILSGESIYPFRDLPKGFFVIGIEGAIRLWSQWRNDYKTMFK